MATLQVRGADFSVTKQKAIEDAKKFQAGVIEDCTRDGKEPPPYLLQELIGKGSFGRVYKATNEKNATVAVKIIDIEESDTLNPKQADTYSEFLKEINALKLLSDGGAKNINHVLDVLPVGQSMWMVIEYCAGGSVATLMRPTAPGGLQEKWIIPILREVSEAVFWVHKQGIIHRDIKCANVLITEDGGVQLCDFGVAGIVEHKFDKRSTFIGTPHWMAPELFDPDAAYGTEVDIWAFGSMVFEIASGLPPNVMAGIGIKQLGNYLKTHTPRLDGDLYSENLKSMVAFCLVENPAQRPTIENVQNHPYIFNTAAEYPTASLANLVKGYKLWESQGGSRKSLFAPGGAIGPSDYDYASTSLDNDEWNFSTTADFDRQVLDNSTAQAVYDVYGSNIDLEMDFNEDTSKPAKAKSRRRPPPQLPAVKAPLEKVFDPNTISNYEDNARLYYGGPIPLPASDLPLRDDSAHATVRESLIDLDASLHGSDLSQFVDMDTIRGSSVSIDYDHDEFYKPPRSDPAELNPNRRTQDWKFPSMAPPASANPEMSHFPFNENTPSFTPGSGSRPPLIHHPTEPAALPSQSYELSVPRAQDSRISMSSLIDLDELSVPRAQDNRISTGSLIDLDESLAMPELTRPSTANSETGSISGSDIGGANPFDLERHASLYQPMPSSTREPSIYVSDDSDFMQLPKSDDINGNGLSHRRNGSNYTDDGGYGASDFLSSEYLRQSRIQSQRIQSGMNMGYSQQQQQQQLVLRGAEFNGAPVDAVLPNVPAPPSERVMQGATGKEDVREDVMRLLGSFAEHLSFANAHVSSLPVRRVGRQNGDLEAIQ